MSRWVKINNAEEQQKALKQARGCYQRNLLHGRESLSGSTLRGTAARYGYWYARSRRNLLDRMSKAGVKWSECKGNRGARILVIG